MSADSRPTARALGRTGVALLVVALALAVPGLQPASATSGEGMEVLCDVPGYGCVAHTGYRGQGVWGANHGRTGHNCTSYVSYRLAQLGVAQPWRPMGDGGRWDDNGRKHVRVDDLPAAGAVAGWEGGSRLSPRGSGHVAYVELVEPGYIEITDDTYGGTSTRRVRIHRGSPYWPDTFIHIRDLAPAPTMGTGSWTLSEGRTHTDATDLAVTFGAAGDVPVAGDWDGDGDANVGTFRDGVWTLTNAHAGARMRPHTFRFGQAGDVPVVGDWDGDGADTIGVFRNGTWILAATNGDRPEVHQVQLGSVGDTPVAGDWDSDGVDTIGVYREGEWTLANSPVDGVQDPADVDSFTLGQPGDRPVAGNWDGVRGDTVGLVRDGTFRLFSDNSASPRKTRTVQLGDADDLPMAGSWTRTARDTVAVVR